MSTSRVNCSPLGPAEELRLPADAPPILTVVIDTEEEFDWSRPHDRSATSVTAMAEADRFQEIADQYGVRPCYAADYPVVTQPEGQTPLRKFLEEGRGVLAAHLHPWVNPPHREEVNTHNSFPGNLPRELEQAKLEELLAATEKGLGVRPTIYKAGRYGIGPHTAEILSDAGVEIDLSVCPPFDYSGQHGPDFSSCRSIPFRFGPGARLLEIPTSGEYVGPLGRWSSHHLHQLAGAPLLRPARLPGILARTRLVDRLMLSPEGYSHEEHRRLTACLLRQGARTFTFSFHSPSLRPGCTPYVRDEGGLESFLDRCRRYFDYFFGELNGVAMTPHELQAHLEAHS